MRRLVAPFLTEGLAVARGRNATWPSVGGAIGLTAGGGVPAVMVAMLRRGLGTPTVNRTVEQRVAERAPSSPSTAAAPFYRGET